MADIVTSTLQIGSNNLILRDADAQAKVAVNTQDITELKEEYTQILDSAYVTDTASGSIASFPDGADGVPVKDLKVYIEPVQSGSGDPSPDNVRPISGHTQAVVTRTGKNLIPYPYANTTKETNGITFTDNGDGTITANGTSTGSAQFVLTGAVKNKEYLGCILSGSLSSDARIRAQVNGEPWTMFATDNGNGAVITDSGYENIRFILHINNGVTLDNAIFKPMLRAPSDIDGTYTPFVKKDTYTIALPTAAGTVYGGTLDVTTGVLTVDRALITLTSASQLGTGVAGTGGYYVGIKGSNIAKYDRTKATVISDKMVGVADSVQSTSAYIDKYRVNVANNNYVIIHAPVSSGITSNDALFSAIGETQFVVEINNPHVYQLTAQEVSTLLGYNSIWNNRGDTEVEYRADTKLYINKLTGITG